MNLHDAQGAPRLGELLQPRSIAVFGATPDKRRFGGRPLHNLLKHGFRGPIFPVNPRRDEVRGLACHASLDTVDAPVDLALVAVPQAAVADTLRQCAARGVRLAVIFSSGFAEAGPAGRAAQEEAVRVAHAGGVRLLGPNGLGFLNTHDRVAAVATGALEQPDLPTGSISLVSQSGAMGFVAVFNRAYDAGVGYRFVAATGNEADLCLTDFLAHYVDDPGTRVVSALVESFRQPEAFVAAARRAVEVGKPVVVLKTGRSEAGVRAAAAHTAALAGEDGVHEAVFERYGVVRVDDVDELWQVPNVLATGRLPAGPRVGVISTSGGFNGILADHLDAQGLVLAPLTDTTREALGRHLPPYAYLGNPLDLTGQFAGGPREAEIFIEALQRLDEDPTVDAIALVQVIVRRDYDDVAAPLLEAMAGLRKPAILVAPGGEISDTGLRLFHRTAVPWFRSAPAAARALRHLWDYARFRRRVERHPPPTGTGRPPAAVRLPDRPPGFAATAALLAASGIPMVPSVVVQTADEAVAAAERLGYPVAVKAVGAQLLHKTDVGGVRTGVDASGLKEAFRAVEAAGRAAAGADGLEGVVIQPMVDGAEMIVGLKYDPQFGPVVAVGAGGVAAELLHDVALLPLPLDAHEVRRRLAGLRVHRLLTGYRNQPPADVDALVELVLAVGRFAAATDGRLAALDLNPVLVAPDGVHVVDALVIGHPHHRP